MYEAVWAGVNNLDKYKENKYLEESYCQLIFDKTNSFDILWEATSRSKLEEYQFNSDFENEIIKNLRFVDFEEIWGFSSMSFIDEAYRIDTNFEEQMGYIEFYKSFKFFSNLKKDVKYKPNSGFEEFYKEIEPVIRKSVENKEKEMKNKMSKGSENLKNLLELRLKRLKKMSDHIDSIKSDKCKTVIYQCKLCNIQSTRLRKLYVSHVIPDHIQVNVKKSEQRRKNKIKVSIESVVKKRFICSNLNCNKQFTKRNARKRHMQTLHRNNYRFVCDKCEKKFRDNSSLVRHIKLKHKMSLFLKCVLCKYVTQKAFNLQRHCERKHVGEGLDVKGQFMCDVCRRSFHYGSQLTKHMEIHQAISIGYNCPICTKLVQEDHICIFDCTKCEKRFKSKVLLNSHINIHVKVESIYKTVSKLSDHDELEKQLLNLKFD